MGGIRLAPIELIDCAGLVPGAWQGKGLGNMFLDEISKADALIHVVDAAGATDDNGRPCKPGTRNPIKDIEFLNYELVMWLLQIVKKDWKKIIQRIKTKKENLVDSLSNRLSGLAFRKTHIIHALKKTCLEPERFPDWTDDDLFKFLFMLQQHAKPMVIAANKIDLPYSKENVEWLQELGFPVIPCSCEAELILRRAAKRELISYTPGDSDFTLMSTSVSEGQKKALDFVKNNVLKIWGSTGIQAIMNQIFFQLLRMIAVYPVENVEKLSDHKGRILPDVYLIPSGSNARQLAYMIHTELGDSFIYAVDARTKRRLGEDYVLNNRDVIKIVSAKGRV